MLRAQKHNFDLPLIDELITWPRPPKKIQTYNPIRYHDGEKVFGEQHGCPARAFADTFSPTGVSEEANSWNLSPRSSSKKDGKSPGKTRGTGSLTWEGKTLLQTTENQERSPPGGPP